MESLTASQNTNKNPNESLIDDDVFNRSDSSDNISRADLTASQVANNNQQEEVKVQIDYEEYIQNKLRDILENPLIEMAKKEISLNAELKVLQEKELALREKTNLLLVKLNQEAVQ
ncbi:UNKNOWN [Stylonychia lemnae]|uniref:Uncharacterized protein n=1 Tax=Stylonychia lemnae TaxID=5949 RepID=A0A078A5U5_STYLE|nr:UNKNOWN [Stylonychia lemnae]|eukprot:CDW77564.1 UNKNOWN [Stylonychia lemnae]